MTVTNECGDYKTLLPIRKAIAAYLDDIDSVTVGFFFLDAPLACLLAISDRT